MPVGTECPQCSRLLQSASAAVIRHLQAEARLEMAQYRREKALIPALEAAVEEASKERGAAIQAYKTHEATHGS